MARIAIDMDEVIADALGGIIDHYNQTTNSTLQPEDLAGKKVYEYIQEDHHSIIEDLLALEDFWMSLKVIEGSQEVIEKLSTQHDIFISTAAMEVPASLKPKFHWLKEHFPFIPELNFIFCGHKHIVATDYLIDDNPRHFPQFGGQGILFDSPHNRMVNEYPRARSWYEVEELLLELESNGNGNGKK